MDFYWYIIIAAVVAVLFVLIVSYVCFRMAFYVKRGKNGEDKPMPLGEEYLPYRELMNRWRSEMLSLPHKDIYITSHDGLTLHGQYFEYNRGGVTEIMFHGYRGSAERDMCGGVQRCFALGRNALVVDQRGSGKSGGNVISFGVNERKDCLRWVDYAIKNVEGKFVLTGISMGAATVVMASGEILPDRVIGVVADCGYSTARDIIKKTIREMHLPVGLSYPFVKLGARLYGGFNLEETCPLKAIKNCKIPVIFFHGEADAFIPYEMSREVYDACPAKKRLVIVPKAAHGLSYPVDQEGYLKELRSFEFLD